MKQNAPAPEPRSGDSTDPTRLMRAVINSGAAYAGDFRNLPPGPRHAVEACRLYFSYRHNGFLLTEVLQICAEHSVYPPPWVLEALQEGFQRFSKGRVSLERALGLTKRDREEYEQYRDQGDIMREVRKAIDADRRRRIEPACRAVAGKCRLNADTVERQYRKFWRGFFDYVTRQ